MRSRVELAERVTARQIGLAAKVLCRRQPGNETPPGVVVRRKSSFQWRGRQFPPLQMGAPK